MTKKATIPKAIREQCWIEVFGKSFEHKCYIPWCKNIINVFDFQRNPETIFLQNVTIEINVFDFPIHLESALLQKVSSQNQCFQ